MAAEDSWNDEARLLKRSLLREVNAGIRSVAEDFDQSTGPDEWEFLCECGARNCHASARLTVEAFTALRDAGELVLGRGHAPELLVA